MKRFGGGEMESISVSSVLMLLARGNAVDGALEIVAGRDHQLGQARQPAGRVFECKTCSRRFPSFQALGGHRASHKKPRLGDGARGRSADQAQAAKPRVHECTICGSEFAVGQALGGHMRRHRAAVHAEALLFGHGPAPAPAPEKKPLGLDLNLPPLTEVDDVELERVGLSLEIMERKIAMGGRLLPLARFI